MSILDVIDRLRRSDEHTLPSMAYAIPEDPLHTSNAVVVCGSCGALTEAEVRYARVDGQEREFITGECAVCEEPLRYGHTRTTWAQGESHPGEDDG